MNWTEIVLSYDISGKRHKLKYPLKFGFFMIVNVKS